MSKSAHSLAPVGQSTMPCPFCSEEIKADAKKCRFCGEWLTGEHSAPRVPNGVVGVVPASTLGSTQPEVKAVKRERPRFGAGIVGGFLAGFLSYFIISTVAGEPQIWTLWVCWFVFGVIFARNGWSTAWANLSIMSFLWPVAVFIMGAGLTSEASSDAEVAGATLGTFFAAGVAGLAGFFFGIMFALLAFFTKQPKAG